MEEQQHNNRDLELAKKWLDGTITPSEAEEYTASYNQDDGKALDVPTSFAANEMQLKNRIFKAIDKNKTPIIRIQNRMVQAASVAAIFLAMLGGAFWYNSKSSDGISKNIAQTTLINGDVLPGVKKATLTLDDGSLVVLDTVKNGRLASQGTTNITNVDGSLKYDANTDGKMRYNTLTTKKGEMYPVTLSDGTTILLDASTTLRFPVSFTGNSREVEINGRAWFEVAKNKDKPFYVIKGDKKVRVLGTHFDVNAYDNEKDIKVTLVEGSVQVISGAATEMLKPGQQAVLENKSNQISVIENADVEQAIAWKNGKIVFHNADLSVIIKDIERWYNVTVEIDGNLQQRNFYFDVSRSAKLSELLQVFDAYHIHSTLDGEKRTLTIKP